MFSVSHHVCLAEVSMSDIHYFPRYSQPENVVTNNTLLLLLRLLHYNRLKFERFMEGLCAEQEVQLAGSWLQFRQQIGTGSSIVDGFIAQGSIKIAVETKRTGAFDAVQLENHLKLFGTEQNKLLILLSPSLGETAAQQLALFRDRAMSRTVQVVHTSFEDIIKECRDCLSEHDEEMLALVDDYESFCSHERLLPKDQYTMYTPPCRLSLAANMQFFLYYCPVARSVRQAKYLGIYANRRVQAIGQIAKIVACDMNVEDETVTVADEAQHITQDEKLRILGAGREALQRDWNISAGYKFFLCDKLEETDFRKKTPRGIMGPRYIELNDVLGRSVPIPNDLRELARLLRQHKWK
jgi:hypothetical protein